MIDAVRPAKENAYGRDNAPAPNVAEHRLNTDDEREPGRTVGTGRQPDGLAGDFVGGGGEPGRDDDPASVSADVQRWRG